MSHHSKVPSIEEFLGKARESMLFKHIVKNTQGVSIGPLEYCGNGHIIRTATSAFLAVCKGDPSIPQHFEERLLRGLNRVSTKLEAPGSHKRKRMAKENKALGTKLSTLKAGYARAAETKGATSKGQEDGIAEEPKPKRQRMSADQKLALQNI